MRGDLEACGDDAAARALVIKAPEFIEASKKLRQKWIKIVKSASDEEVMSTRTVLLCGGVAGMGSTNGTVGMPGNAHSKSDVFVC